MASKGVLLGVVAVVIVCVIVVAVLILGGLLKSGQEEETSPDFELSADPASLTIAKGVPQM
jgi:hypothetical protein